MEAQIEKSCQLASDQRSGIILRRNTRTILEDEITQKAASREFVKIEDVDKLEVRTKFAKLQQSQGFFTIGVITDKTP